MKHVRLFLAIPLHDALKNSIQNALGDIKLPGKPVSRQNLHITVHFIGETSEKEITRLISDIEKTIIDTKTFWLEPEQIILKKIRSGSMVWVSIKPSDDFVAFVKKIRKALDPQNYNARITPHITLSREKNTFHPVNLELFPIKLEIDPIPVNRIELWKSTLQKGGSVYSTLESFFFQNNKKL